MICQRREVQSCRHAGQRRAFTLMLAAALLVAQRASSGIKASVPSLRPGRALPRRTASVAIAVACYQGPKPALAERSRTDGYEFQRSISQWRQALSPGEYFVLRQGGTEEPGSSTLLKEKRAGVFKCVGCGSSLFDSADKFDSGTGWPSFASRLPGVEAQDVNPLQLAVLGAELRCARCGGHLGDVFGDGKLWFGTRAFDTSLRHCIDGAALVFYPADGSAPVRGEGSPPKFELPDWLQPKRSPLPSA